MNKHLYQILINVVCVVTLVSSVVATFTGFIGSMVIATGKATGHEVALVFGWSGGIAVVSGICAYLLIKDYMRRYY